MKTLRTVIGLLGMALGIGGVVLALSMDRVFSSSGIFSWGSHDRTFMLVLVVLGFAVFLAAYDFTFRAPRRR